MFRPLLHRWGPYALLLAVAGSLSLPALGAPSLWDIDEGNNAEAGREMLEADNWVVPTFNYQLRVDKPALLYWLQIAAYRTFGVNEFAARLPSALAALATVLLAYELGRCLFRAASGLLAGLILVSSAGFCAAAHFANPDALLNACTVLTLFTFWQGLARNRPGWFLATGMAAGLAVLAKGPVGLVLPLAVAALFLFRLGRLRLFWGRPLLLGTLGFTPVALPWYLWVALETKAQFLSGFLLTHNVSRFLQPMEHHGGPIVYYLVVLAIGFAPWSAFFGLAGWDALREYRAQRERSALPTEPSPASEGSDRAARCFLGCWIVVYLVFFSLSRTKLPNYILPAYVPIALLLGRSLQRWRCGLLQPPAWLVDLSLACLALMGIGVSAGLLVAGGVLKLPVLGDRYLAGLEACAGMGILPILGAAAGLWCTRRSYRTGLIVSVTACAVLFVGILAVRGSLALDAFKAPRALVGAAHARQTDRDIRIGCHDYFQPSLVFYARREVVLLETGQQALEFLRSPLPVYLFVPLPAWERLAARAPHPGRLLARHYDLYRHCDIVVVTNQ